jgi:hypothetical protein
MAETIATLESDERATIPIQKAPSHLPSAYHTATFSKTQNIKDILRGINDCLSGLDKNSDCLATESFNNNFSMTNSIFH